MNLFHTRGSAFGSGLLASVLIAAMLTGCSSGQLSQTATQEPAVNGISAGVGAIALRDVRIRADQKSDFVQPGESVELLFSAANLSATETDRLRSITSDWGSVTISPASPEIPAGRMLIVGKPEGPDAEALQAQSNADKATATVKLSKPISNGLTYNFVFTFERAGQTTVGVPVTAGDTAPRAEQSPSHGEGH